MSESFNVWEGVYRTFSEAPSAGQGFEGETWLARSLHGARAELERQKAGKALSRAVRYRNAILPSVLATMLVDRKRVRVVDVGGGLGLGFMAAASAVRDIERVDYHIVEVGGICRAGRELFDGAGPVFHEAFPRNRPFDVVYASSVLQYIDDWREIISTMLSVGPAHLLLSDVYAGAFRSYVSLQNYYESRIPCWFLNFDELTGEVERHGYRLCLIANATSEILGQDRHIPMDNFPEHLRVAGTFHLMFARRSSEATAL